MSTVPKKKPETNENSSVEPRMRFSMGSISKTFLGALIMRLAEEGKLTLDDPLHRWLPEFPQVTNTVTIRQLLAHTSGIYNLTEHPDFLSTMITTNRFYEPRDTLGFLRPAYFRPGTGYHYSNSGFILLGMVAEAAGEEGIATQVRSRFLGPLGLKILGPCLRFGGVRPPFSRSSHLRTAPTFSGSRSGRLVNSSRERFRVIGAGGFLSGWRNEYPASAW